MATDTTTMPPELAAAMAAFKAGNIGIKPGNYPPVSNAGMYPSPHTPYANFSDQLQNAFTLSGLLPGMPNNLMGGNNVVRYGFKNAPANVGGADWGKTAYTAAGFNPYLGRGNGFGGLLAGGPPGSVGSTPPPGGPGGGPPPVGSVTPMRPSRPDVGGGPGTLPPPPAGSPYQPPAGPGVGTTRPTPGPGGTPYQPPGGPTMGTTRPQPGVSTQPPATVDTRPKTGLLAPPVSNNPYGPNTPTPNYTIDQIQNQGTTPETSVQAMANQFMALPESQRMDYFNAISQYGVTHGQNLGGELDQALRLAMPGGEFQRWLQTGDAGQGSTIKSTAGLPQWLITGLGG